MKTMDSVTAVRPLILDATYLNKTLDKQKKFYYEVGKDSYKTVSRIMRQTGKNADLRAHQKLFNHPYRIQVIDRAVEVLDFFAFNKPELSVGEVSAPTGLHKSTAH